MCVQGSSVLWNACTQRPDSSGRPVFSCRLRLRSHPRMGGCSHQSTRGSVQTQGRDATTPPTRVPLSQAHRRRDGHRSHLVHGFRLRVEDKGFAGAPTTAAATSVFARRTCFDFPDLDAACAEHADPHAPPWRDDPPGSVRLRTTRDGDPARFAHGRPRVAAEVSRCLSDRTRLATDVRPERTRPEGTEPRARAPDDGTRDERRQGVVLRHGSLLVFVRHALRPVECVSHPEAGAGRW